MTRPTHKEELHAGTARGLHHLTGRLRGPAEGWPGWWGPEDLAWLGRQPERDHTILMGANTYRLMSGFATESKASASEEPMTDEGAATAPIRR